MRNEEEHFSTSLEIDSGRILSDDKISPEEDTTMEYGVFQDATGSLYRGYVQQGCLREFDCGERPTGLSDWSSVIHC